MFRPIYDAPEHPAPDVPANSVSLGRVGHDSGDPSRAFCYVDDSGQVLVEVTLDPDGDKVQAYLCLAQTGPNAGDFIPVRPGEAVLVVFPGSDPDQGYIIGRLDDVTTSLAATVCGLSTTGAGGAVRQFRWLVTPGGQVYAIQAGGEVMLQAGGAGVQIKGAQVLIDGAAHLGASFALVPSPGQVAGGASETAPSPAGPFAPPQGATATTPPFVGNAKAIVRATDGVQANIATDEAFFIYLTALNSFVVAVAGALAIPWAYPSPPTAIESQHKGASATHTASD